MVKTGSASPNSIGSAPMSRLTGELTRRPGLMLAAVALLAHLSSSGGYGYFRDELYFIVCGERLDWGYFDQPPLLPPIAAGVAPPVSPFPSEVPAPAAVPP